MSTFGRKLKRESKEVRRFRDIKRERVYRICARREIKILVTKVGQRLCTC